MDRLGRPRPLVRRARSVALITGLLGTAGLALAGCQGTGSATPSPGTATATASASASPGLSVPGTHRATTTYQVSAPVSTVVVTGHVGNVTITGGSGPTISVTQQVDYSKTPPTTTRTVSGNTLTVTYSCPAQVVCGVAYTLGVPRTVAVQVTAGAGSIRLAGLAGNVTAKADVGLISATGLTGASASLTTSVGAISASFAGRAGHGAGLDQGRRYHAARSGHRVLQGLGGCAPRPGHRQRPAERLVRPRHHGHHRRRCHPHRSVVLGSGCRLAHSQGPGGQSIGR